MSESCVISWVTDSPGQDTNEEHLEDYEELELLTDLTASPGEVEQVEQVASFSEP